MGRRVLFVVAVIGVVVGLALVQGFGSSEPVAAATTHSRKVCAAERTYGTARCHAIILTDASGVTPLTSGSPTGYGPADFRAAYGVRGTTPTHVAIVDAYDDPTVQNDLTTYSKTYGLPVLPACKTAGQTACFEKLNQRGTTSYPATNSSWSVETSLDVEALHGVCPGCRITLVEASSASLTNLGAAVDTAVASGAKVVSNSYGSVESGAEVAQDKHYNRPGVTMVVSSGDGGYGTNYPAASPAVVAVGGTSLHMSGGRVTSETAWDGAGSGCSQYEAKPAWQHDKKCASRSVADIAADADPATGAAIYDSYPTSGHSGWFTVGGTSLAAPLVAGILAASGNSSSQPAYLYNNGAAFIRDITSGSNGSCSLTYLCKATTGYDGPTGLGVLSHL
jgi:subtilase family serine protease